MKPVRKSCQLRPEVLKGELSDAIFAADFGKILEENAPDVYQDAEIFFRNTHPAAPLKKVATTIFDRLSDENEAGAIIRLSTGFGGGKTHTLIALWHLAKNIQQSTLGTELVPAPGRPKSVAVAGADGKLPGSVLYRDYGTIKTHSLWADIAYHLGGEVGYNKMSQVDNTEKVPDAGSIRQILPADKPVLILLDEIPVYMAKLSDKGRRSLLSFLDSLMSEIGARRQAALVITDTARQPSYRSESAELGRLVNGIVGRKASDFDPIGDESAQVIIRRLFEDLDQSAASVVSAEYFNAYKLISEEHACLLPPDASRSDYAEKIKYCYPFHPYLLEIAQNRLSALQDFQKSRGVLRLFARILRDIWENESDIELITAGDLNWTSDRIQSDLLQRLKRDNFKPAVDADIVKHAGKLDDDYSSDIHRRVASALLLESLPLNPNAAMDRADITLAVLRPSDVGTEPSNAMKRLDRIAWHIYEINGKFQFRYEPNANKIVEERAENMPIEDAKMSVRAYIQKYFSGHNFQLVAYPSSPNSVKNSTELKLVLCENEELAQSICDYQDNSNPQAVSLRAFRNAIFAIAPTPAEFEKAALTRRKLMAAEDVKNEQKKILTSREKGTPLLEQIEKMLPGLRKNSAIQSVRAFDRVIFQGRRPISIWEKYIVDDDVLSGIKDGQAQLMKLLKDEGLIYEISDTIDENLLMQLLKGATPSLEHEGAYPANAIHERALSSKRLRLLRDESPIRNSIIRDVNAGRLVVRLPNNDVYDQKGCVTGKADNRRRIDKKLSTLKLSADVLVAPSSAPCVADWIKITPTDNSDDFLTIAEAAKQKNTNEGTVISAISEERINYETRDGQKEVLVDEKFDKWEPVPSQPELFVIATTWEEAINYAQKRPLTKLTLKIDNIDFCNKLMVCAQPFNAESIKLSVIASGKLKDGGSINFKVDNVKFNSSLKPIDIAKRMLRGTADNPIFKAELVLDFESSGAMKTGSKFAQVREHGLNDVKLSAEFGEERYEN